MTALNAPPVSIMAPLIAPLASLVAPLQCTAALFPPDRTGGAGDGAVALPPRLPPERQPAGAAALPAGGGPRETLERRAAALGRPARCGAGRLRVPQSGAGLRRGPLRRRAHSLVSECGETRWQCKGPLPVSLPILTQSASFDGVYFTLVCFSVAPILPVASFWFCSVGLVIFASQFIPKSESV